MQQYALINRGITIKGEGISTGCEMWDTRYSIPHLTSHINT